MSAWRLSIITTVTMLAFAGNSLLCRAALAHTRIDPASFTSVRLLSGAVTLFAIVWIRHRGPALMGNWISAGSLFTYAACFSFAYTSLPAGIGALLLFGAVQATMISYGLAAGERLSIAKSFGMLLALAGLVGLLLPGVEAPPITGAAMMLIAGIAWGIYSLRGRGAGDPLGETAGNFVRTVPMTLLVSLILFSKATPDTAGLLYAVASGTLASGMGYAIWYAALPALRATTAAMVQLSVPAIAALAGALMLGESITLRLVLASIAILGGIAIFITNRAPALSR